MASCRSRRTRPEASEQCSPKDKNEASRTRCHRIEPEGFSHVATDGFKQRVCWVRGVEDPWRELYLAGSDRARAGSFPVQDVRNLLRDRERPLGDLQLPVLSIRVRLVRTQVMYRSVPREEISRVSELCPGRGNAAYLIRRQGLQFCPYDSKFRFILFASSPDIL